MPKSEKINNHADWNRTAYRRKNFPKVKIGDMISHHSHTKLFGAEIDSNLNWKELVNISAEKSKHRPSWATENVSVI